MGYFCEFNLYLGKKKDVEVNLLHIDLIEDPNAGFFFLFCFNLIDVALVNSQIV